MILNLFTFLELYLSFFLKRYSGDNAEPVAPTCASSSVLHKDMRIRRDIQWHMNTNKSQRTDPQQVGSPDFRNGCVRDMRLENYPNRDGFFEKYLSGTDFDMDALLNIGYDYFSARNISAYINNAHYGMYASALGWE